MGFIDRLTDRVEGFLDEVFIPDDLRRRLQRASRLMERGNYQQALDMLGEAEQSHSGHHRTYHLLGLCHFFRGNWEESLDALEDALELRTEPATYLYAGLAAEQLGKPAEAKLYFQKALGSVDQPPFEFDLHFGLGRVLLEMGRTEKAIHELRKARRLGSEEREVDISLARALFEAGDLEEADDLIADLEAADIGVDGMILKARIAEATGESARAALLYERVLEGEETRIEALIGASRAHLDSGAPAKAQQYLLQALEQAEEPTFEVEAHTLLGRAKETAGEREKALEAYLAALEVAGEREELTEVLARAHLGAGRVLLQTGKPDEAAAHFERLTREAPELLQAKARLELGYCRLQQGNYSESRRLLDELERVDLDDGFRARVQHLSGLTSLRSGDAAEALVALQEALHFADKPTVRTEIEEHRREALEMLRPSWDLPDTLEGPLATEKTLRQAIDFTRSAPDLEDFGAPLAEMAEAMATPLSVAIVGEFNVGKSTLVNALLGEEVVPMGVLPTTAHTCFIRYGPRKTARVVYHDDEDAHADEASEGDIGRTVEVNFEEARRRMEEETEAIEHLEFLYPHPQLRSIQFWDTPGFNALDDSHDEIASRALDDAEAILWVFDAKQTLSRTELDRLEQIDDSAERLIVLLNKIDEIGEDQLDELQTYVDDRLGNIAAGSFAISARSALERLTDETQDASETERFGSFREFLDSRFIQRAGRIKTLEVRRRLRRVADSMRERVEGLMERYETLMERVENLSVWLEDLTEEHPAKRAEREARSVDDQFDFALTAVAREIREDLRPQGTFFSRMALDEEDREFVLDVLKHRLVDVLGRSSDRVEEDVGRIEEEITARIGDVLDDLSVQNARSLNRRLDGLYDELRVLRLVLAERVYGQLRARIHGRIDAAGPDVMEAIEEANVDDASSWKDELRQLLPDAADHVDEQLTGWYMEFFLAAARFCGRVERDLQLLRLEAEFRYDTDELRSLLEGSGTVE